jgi:hypothetical protein
MKTTKTTKPSNRIRKKPSSTRRTKTKRGSGNSISGKTIQLIDEVADLLKSGIVFGTKKGMENRRLLERKTKAFVNRATSRLTKAANHGLHVALKNLKK